MRDVLRGTTVIGVCRDGRCVLAADGQVTLGQTVLKASTRKVRSLGRGVVGGFAGASADAFALFDRFEQRLAEHRGQLVRAAVELARDWRQDKVLRRLDAMLLVGDRDHLLVVSGAGEVLEPDDGVMAIGSGGPYALAAARALLAHSGLDPRAVAEESLRIASEICIYTNDRITVLEAGVPE